jgi:2-hydroxychromene-2-carboxylate isomerase
MVVAGCTVVDNEVIDLDQPAWTRCPAHALLRSTNAMDAAVTADPHRYEAVIADNENVHAASGHWGVPTFMFENEPFFGQDRIDLLIWRMQSRGLTRR